MKTEHFLARCICSLNAPRYRSLAVLLLAGLGATAAQSAVTYTYTGAPLDYFARTPGVPNLLGTRVSGAATFDEAVVTNTFTGTVNFLTAMLGTDKLGSLPVFSNTVVGLPSMVMTFRMGQIIDWSLTTSFIVAPGSYLVPVNSTTTGDNISPVTGGSLLGSARNATSGTWTREAPPTVVPLPAALPMLLAGLGAFGALARRKKSR